MTTAPTTWAPVPALPGASPGPPGLGVPGSGRTSGSGDLRAWLLGPSGRKRFKPLAQAPCEVVLGKLEPPPPLTCWTETERAKGCRSHTSPLLPPGPPSLEGGALGTDLLVPGNRSPPGTAPNPGSLHPGPTAGRRGREAQRGGLSSPCLPPQAASLPCTWWPWAAPPASSPCPWGLPQRHFLGKLSRHARHSGARTCFAWAALCVLRDSGARSLQRAWWPRAVPRPAE